MQRYELNDNIDLRQSILWQYDDAKKLQGLIEAEACFFDKEVRGFWRNWYRDVFNLETANAFGLMVWAVILGVSREIRLNTETPAEVFGFGPEADSADNANQNYGHGNFVRTENVLQVKTEQLRMLLKIRAMQLFSNGSLYDVNRMLKKVFGPKAYAVDNFDMTITYVIAYELTLDELFIVKESNALKPPAAVDYRLVFIRANNWGFAPYRKNFDNSNFY